jgi:hypothetical protein
VKQPPLVVANACIVRTLWSFAVNGAVNVYAARIGTAVINQALAEALGSAIKTSFTSAMGPSVTAATQLVRVGVRDIRAANLPEFRDTGPPVSGTALASDVLPKATAICITLRTAGSGKSHRGRTYIGGWDESHNDVNGNTLPAANTAAINFVGGIRSAMTANGLTMVVLSRPAFRETIVETSFDAAGNVLETHTTTHNARPGFITDVSALESRTAFWEYQRRRDNQRGGLAQLLTPVEQRVF